MNKVLKSVLNDKNKKHMNRVVMEGIPKHSILKAPEFVDALIRDNIKELDPSIKLVYKGFRYLDPREEYETDKIGTSYDLAMNYLYKIELQFELDGEPFNRILALPFVEENGSVIKLSDTQYVMLPVLTEYAINPTGGKVFIRLLKDKLNFMRQDRPFIVNGILTSLPYIYAHTYKLKSNGIFDKVPLGLYLFYKDGLFETFKKRAGVDVIITDKDEEVEKFRETHDVYEVTGKKPKMVKISNYRPPKFKVLLPKEHSKNLFAKSLIANLLFAFELYSDFVNLYYKVHYDSLEQERGFWKLLLAKIIFKDAYEIDKLLSNIQTHLDLLKTYLDVTVKSRLEELGIYLNDFYDLIAYVMENYHKLVINSEKRSGDIENRYIEVLYYVLFDIIAGINKTFFKINENFRNKQATIKNINSIFNQELSPKKIYSIIKNGGTNLAIMGIDYTGDNLYPKISSILEDQNRGRGVKRDKDNAFPPYIRNIRAEDIVFGSILYLPKKSPTPRLRINPYIEINPNNGKFIIDEYKNFIDIVNSMLEGKLEDDELLDRIIVDEDDKVEGA